MAVSVRPQYIHLVDFERHSLKQNGMEWIGMEIDERILTLKTSITTAADDIHKYFFSFFSEKIR